MDVYDRAQLTDSHFLTQALRRQAQKSQTGKHASRTHCIDCDDTIPQGRRKATPGCIRCVGCAEKNETLNRR